jgi:type I restriction enzyme S subunit
VPPSHEQDAITAFLAYADRRINRLIHAKRRLIELLNEQKQAIIHRAVSHGLDPNVRLKPSGIDWLSDVPEHWEVVALRMRYSVQLGKMLDTKRITGHHLVPYLRNTDVQWDRINSTNLPMMDILEREHERYLIKPGDLLVCEGGDVGRSAFWDGGLPICGYQKALHRLRPISDEHECPRFLFYAMFAASKRELFIADGSENTIAHLTAEKLRRHRFAFPPRAEQEAIASHLDITLSELEHAVERATREIDLLREYRTRLIADVVTGRLDVRGMELPTLEETEVVEEWNTDEDTEADAMGEIEGVDA